MAAVAPLSPRLERGVQGKAGLRLLTPQPFENEIPNSSLAALPSAIASPSHLLLFQSAGSPTARRPGSAVTREVSRQPRIKRLVTSADRVCKTVDAQKETLASMMGEGDRLQLAEKNEYSVWPANSTAGAGDREAKSLLHLEMERRIKEAEGQWSHSQIPISTATRWRLYREVLGIFVDKNTMYKGLLTTIVQELDDMFHEYLHTSEELKDSTRKLKAIEETHKEDLSALSQKLGMQVSEEKAKNAEMEAKCNKITTKMEILKRKYEAQQVTVNEMTEKLGAEVRSHQALSYALQLKRTAIQDLSDKVSFLTRDNTSLHDTFKQNEELWREIDMMRGNLENAAELSSKREEALEARATEEKEFRSQMGSLVSHLKRVCAKQVNTIREAESANVALNAELVELKKQRDSMTQTFTPRPAWREKRDIFTGVTLRNRTSEIVNLIAEEFKALTNKYQKAMRRVAGMEKMLEYFDDGDLEKANNLDLPPASYFIGLGTAPWLPSILHGAYGVVRNKRYTLDMLNVHIVGFWESRVQAWDAGGEVFERRQQFIDAFAQWVGGKSKSAVLKHDIAYNIWDSLHRFRYTSYDVEIFLRLCEDQLSEKALFVFRRAFGRLRGALKQVERQIGKRGLVKKRIVNEVLSRIYPTKTEAAQLKLLGSILRDMNNFGLREKTVYREDVEFAIIVGAEGDEWWALKASEFVQMLKLQLLQEWEELRVDIQEALLVICAHHTSATITTSVICEVLQVVDPQWSPEYREECACVLLPKASGTVADALDKLRLAYFERSTPKVIPFKRDHSVLKKLTEMVASGVFS